MDSSIGARSILGSGLRALSFLGLIASGHALLLPDAGAAVTLDPEELVSVVIECSDGLDNDHDGATDHPDDPDCASAADESERTPTRLRPAWRPDLFRALPVPRLPEGVELEVVHASAYGVSGDGRVKVGALMVRDTRPQVSYAEAASIVWLGLRPRIVDEAFADVGTVEYVTNLAAAISDDGRWVAGTRGTWETGVRAYRWRRNGEIEDLPVLSETSHARSGAVSNDGVVVGLHDFSAVRWDDRGALLLDPIDPSGSLGSIAFSITPDGRTTVGAAHHPVPGLPHDDHPPILASVWTGSDPRPVPLIVDEHGSTAHDASDDGRVIVGTSNVFFEQDPIGGDPMPGLAAFRWTPQGFTWFGVPKFQFSDVEARFSIWSTSGDGAISVGWLPPGYLEDFPGPVILAGGKLRSLVDLLANEYGVDLDGWNFSTQSPTAIEISGDGRTLVGNADGPGGSWTAAFQVRLPPPCSDGLDNDGDGRVDYTEDHGCRGPGDSEESRRELRRVRRR